MVAKALVNALLVKALVEDSDVPYEEIGNRHMRVGCDDQATTTRSGPVVPPLAHVVFLRSASNELYTPEDIINWIGSCLHGARLT